jgi:hypothetical protein
MNSSPSTGALGDQIRIAKGKVFFARCLKHATLAAIYKSFAFRNGIRRLTNRLRAWPLVAFLFSV